MTDQLPIPRDAKGRVLPGYSLNVGGKPRKDEEVERILRERTPEAVEELFRLALSGKREMTRYKCIELILAYRLGKPAQQVDLSIDLAKQLKDGKSLEELESYYLSRYGALPAQDGHGPS